MNSYSTIALSLALMLIASSLIEVQAGLVSVNGVSPDLAVASGNENGAGGITKNKIAGNQDQKLTVEQDVNNENSQSSGGGRGILGRLL